MASRRYVPLASILIICLDISSLVVIAAAAVVAWDPKTSRYDNYNLDKGPVFYEAYYPDTQDAYQEKRYFDRSTVLETSFQMPFERFTYSAEIAGRPVPSNGSFVVMDNEKILPKERKAIESRRNYDIANKLVPVHDERSTIFDNDKSPRTANIEDISKLVRRAISRDLENWNALERYLDRTGNQGQPGVYSIENRENNEGNSYSFQVNRRSFDPSKQPGFKVLRKLEAHNAKQQPTYFEEVNTGGNTITNKMSVGDTRSADAPPIDVISDPLPLENIFQPRPQLIRYTFFKDPTPRLDKQINEVNADPAPRNYGDNLINEKITDNSRDKQVKGNVKVTSIEVSELPRHKTRHHHGEWPKRDYSANRHRSQSVGYPII